MSNSENHIVGETVKIIARNHGHEFVIGETVTITHRHSTHYMAKHVSGRGQSWAIADDEVESTTEFEPVVPLTISFTDETRDRSTARDYLLDASQAKRVDVEHREILARAAAGETVDLRKLHAALEATQRANLTRYSASTQRREAGKRIAHLLYIVNGVLDAHLQGLPVVEQNGPHSPALKTARAEADRAAEALAAEVGAHAATKAAHRNREGQIERLITSRDAIQEAGLQHQARADRAENKIIETQKRLEADLSRLADEASTTVDLLTYALGLLTIEQRQRVEGFKDALTR